MVGMPPTAMRRKKALKDPPKKAKKAFVRVIVPMKGMAVKKPTNSSSSSMKAAGAVSRPERPPSEKVGRRGRPLCCQPLPQPSAPPF